jgi:hypothetical protein
MGLVTAVADVLRDGLPGLFGSTPSSVALTVDRAALTVEALPGQGAAEPRRTDGTDLLPFAGTGPYTLSRAPAAGPRQLRLQGDQGRVALRDDEIRWDADDPRRFTLVLDDRDATGITAVRVTYSITVVRTRLQVAETVHIGLSGVGQEDLERAEALVLAVLTLEGRRIAEASRDDYLDGDYGATVTTDSVDVRGAAAADGGRVLEVRTRREITADRVLREDEGRPITRIHGPRRSRPEHPVDIPIDVDA